MEKLRSLYRPGAKTSFYKQVVGFARQFRLENRAQLALDARFYYIPTPYSHVTNRNFQMRHHYAAPLLIGTKTFLPKILL